MKSMTILALVAGGLLVGSCASSGTRAAQSPQQQIPTAAAAETAMEMDMEMPPLPQILLRMRENLELTGQQVQRLEAIGREMEDAHHAPMHAAMQGMREAEELLRAERPDWARFESRLRAAAEAHAEAHLAMARAGVEARNVLTPEQRDRVAAARGEIQEQVRQMMLQMMEAQPEGPPPDPERHTGGCGQTPAPHEDAHASGAARRR